MKLKERKKEEVRKAREHDLDIIRIYLLMLDVTFPH